MLQDVTLILRTQGYKVTEPRKWVLQALEKAPKPLSPYEIQGLLDEQGKHLNHVTIYRILDLFCRLNLVHRVFSTGRFIRCTLGDNEGCHRFMVCQRCGIIQEFADEDLCHEESESARNLGFHTQYHLSESSGLCSSCYSKQRKKKGF